ncbi:MAG TPA: hypothetical protein DEV93_01380 [Chloroflexi bacterium]|jgi:hypothetical protein|nr:hypothetical protein [Chloroflexota bacterium]
METELNPEIRTKDVSNVLSLTGTFAGEEFVVTVDDKEVAEIMRRFEKPADGVTTLLRVGASACHAASTGFDLHALRKEMDGAVRETCQAISELRDHVQVFAGNDGPLTEAIQAASGVLVAQIQQAVAAQADADSPGTLLAKVQGATRTFEEMMVAVRTKINEDLAGAVEKHSQAVSIAVREMKELDPNSAIGGAFNRVESRLKDLGEKIVGAQAASSERMRGTAKGADFEEEVAAVAAGIAAVYGDRAERTGDQPGKVVLNTRPSKRGDVTCFIGDAPAIVLEAMDRSSDQLKSALVVVELEEALRNRDATAAIAVVSSSDNTLMCHQPIQVLGPNRWAVVYERGERSPLALQVAYRLARELAVAPAHGQDALDMERVRAGVDDVNKCVTMLGDVRAQLANIRLCHDKSIDALAKYERQVRDAVARLLASLAPQSLDEAA